MCPFEVVYGFKPITPLEMLPLPSHHRSNMEASKRADYVKKMHLKVKEEIERKGKMFADRANKRRKKLLWVHYRKDRFPDRRKSKLMPRGDGPFKVLEKINDNAYKIELPGDDYAVSSTFNVADLSPFFGGDNAASRTTPFQVGETDEGISTILPHSPISNQDTKYNLQNIIYKTDEGISTILPHSPISNRDANWSDHASACETTTTTGEFNP
jgi:hypothetical protein